MTANGQAESARELLLLRHGKTKRRHPGPDLERPLKTSGKRQVQKIGSWLQQHGLMPDLVVSSPAVRAVTSAEKALKAGGQGADGIVVDQRLYEAELESVLAVLAGVPAATRRTMLVGHNPWMDRLLQHLTGDASAPGLGTGTLARLAMPDDWTDLPAGCGRLLDLVAPDELPAKFPFPGGGAAEFRDRPAYYYRQSAVIPYRETDGQLEILIISSSKRNHWGVPKGIHELGLSSQDSAAKEAEEEAGVLGEVIPQPVGEYAYKKWGGRCTVTVYPMKVTKMLPPEDWDENHRERQWLSPDQAIARLKDPALADIVAAFVAAFHQD